MGTDVLRLRVAAKTLEATDIWSFRLTATDGAPLPGFSAGAHVDVHIGGLIRQYSLWNGPGETDCYRIAVLRDAAGRGGSVQVCDTLQLGDEVLVGAPRNHFPLVKQARRTLLFAGGIGITPILAMAQALSRESADFTFHYCSRSPERAAFRSILEQADFADRVEFHFDSGSDAQKLQARVAIGQPDPGTHLYVCGPGGFIDLVRATAFEAGWHSENVHQEFFANTTAKPLGVDSGCFKVRIASTGATLDVPANRTIVEVLADAGKVLPVSCAQGVCGTCITKVLEGVPDHRDLYFTDAERKEGGQILPCCSRSLSPLLVLDL